MSRIHGRYQGLCCFVVESICIVCVCGIQHYVVCNCACSVGIDTVSLYVAIACCGRCLHLVYGELQVCKICYCERDIITIK